VVLFEKKSPREDTDERGLSADHGKGAHPPALNRMSILNVKDLVLRLKDDLLDFVYPQSCPICEKPLTRAERCVCQRCWDTLTILPSPFCPYCKSFLEDEKSATRCGCECRNGPEGRTILAVRSLGTFDDHYQKLIHRFKYRRNLPLGRRLAQRLGQVVSETTGFVDCDLVIPVPLHRARHRERGFNQSDVLAHGVSQATGVVFGKGILKRKKNTKDQTLLNAQQRAENVKDAFQVKLPNSVNDKRVILVDDVMTTGATLNECARMLSAAGARQVLAATLAVVVD
jgi:ComF family protein